VAPDGSEPVVVEGTVKTANVDTKTSCPQHHQEVSQLADWSKHGIRPWRFGIAAVIVKAGWDQDYNSAQNLLVLLCTASLSDTTIWRWLNEDAIRPWQHCCWIFPRDPDFETKAGRIPGFVPTPLEGP